MYTYFLRRYILDSVKKYNILNKKKDLRYSSDIKKTKGYKE